MSADPDKSPSEHPLLNSLFEAATGKTELALEYERAKTLDDLFVIASNRVCLAAFQIMSCFRLPKRGTLILALLKRINRYSYDRYWDQSNRLFSECAIFVTSRLRAFTNQHGSVYADNQFFEQMTTWTGVQWSNMIKMSADETERFKTDMTKTLIDFEDNPLANDSDRHSRIIDALGRNPLISEIPEFAKAVTMHDPLRLVDPINFVPNYERLSHGRARKET